MKKTKEIVGLPVIALSGGTRLGTVQGLVVNPASKKVDYLLIERPTWYGEMRLLSYDSIIGVGEFAVTTQEESKVIPVSNDNNALKLLQADVRVLGTKVMTNKGKAIGTVSEFSIDPDDGKILGCELAAAGEGETEIFPAEKIITLSSELVIVDEAVKAETGTNESEVSLDQTSQLPVSEVEETKQEGEKPIKVFEEHQRKYLLGRRVGKDILDEQGNVLAKEGDEITEELVEKVFEAGKYIELTMNVK